MIHSVSRLVSRFNKFAANKLGITIAAAGLLHAAPSLHAQIAPYAMFSADHYSGLGVGPGTASNQSGGMTPLGGTFGVQDEFFHGGPIHFGSDARFLIANGSNSTSYGNHLAAGLFGARLSVNPMVLPLRPYVQAEVGLVGHNNGTQPNKDVNFAYQVQFGGDWTLIPHLAARVEYGVGQVETPNNNHTLQTFGAGLVLRLF